MNQTETAADMILHYVHAIGGQQAVEHVRYILAAHILKPQAEELQKLQAQIKELKDVTAPDLDHG